MKSTPILRPISGALALVILVGVLFSARIVSAAVVVQHTIHEDSQTFSNDSSGNYVQSLGNLGSTTISQVDMYFKLNSGGTRSLNIRRCDNSDYQTTAVCTNRRDSSSTNQTVVNSTKTLYEFVFAQDVYTNNQYVYLEMLSAGGVSNFTIYGNIANTYSNGSCYIQVGVGACTTLDQYFVVYDGLGAGTYSNTLQEQVYEILEPDQFEVTTDANPVIQFNYLNLNELSIVGVEVIDQSNNNLILRTGETTASSNTTDQYSRILSLNENHAYRIRGYLRNASSTRVVFGPYRDFSTVSDQFFNASSTLINLTGNAITEQNASSTLISVLNSISNAPAILSRKIPFGYFYDIKDILTTTANATGTTFQAVSINFSAGTSSLASSTLLNIGIVEVFSINTVKHFMNPTLLALFRNLAAAALWMTFAGYLWNIKNRVFV